MKGLDDKVSELEAKLSKLAMDITKATVAAAAGTAGATAGAMPLQSAFGGLGLGSTLTPGVNNPAPAAGTQITLESMVRRSY